MPSRLLIGWLRRMSVYFPCRRISRLGATPIALVLCLLVTACRPSVGVGVGYAPPVVPVKFSATFTIHPDGTISFGGSVGLITEIGNFSIEAHVETNSNPRPDETILIIRHRRGMSGLVDSVYRIRTGEEIDISINGRTHLAILNRNVFIDASKSQITSLVVTNAPGLRVGPVIALAARRWLTFGIARVAHEPGGVIRIAFSQQLNAGNKWAGVIANVPRVCGYTIEMQARVVSQLGNQSGYGVSSGALISQSQPEAAAFQYDFGFGGYRIGIP